MTDELDLFNQPPEEPRKPKPEPPPGARAGRARELGQEGLGKAESHNQGLLERLVPIAQYLARQAGPDGVTVTEVRKEGVRIGVLTGYETRNQLSALGGLMRRAGLRATGEVRRSDLDVTHAIRQVVWRLP